MNYLKNPGFIIRVAISLGYVVLGIMLLANYRRIDFLTPKFSILLAVLLFVYGIFRAYRAYRFVHEEEGV
jgi:hypothetical protein